MKFQGARVAVITGAGQGIGRAIAIELSNVGIQVAAVGRTQAKVIETVAMLSSPGVAIAADLTNPHQVRAAFQSTADQLGGIDILVNCAAEYSPFRLDEATDFQITNMISQSLTSAMFCMREAINFMRKRGGGDIVNMSTQSVELPQPFMTVYAAAKSGLETLSQGLRYELKGEDFRIMICQVGVVAQTVPKPGFAELRERMSAAWQKTGVAPMYAYPGSPATGIAAAVAHAVSAPRDVYVQVIKLRGAEFTS